MTRLTTPPREDSYITRGEFHEFGKRMEFHFLAIDAKLEALHKAVSEVVARDAAGEWFGPRTWTMLKLAGPALIGGAIAYLVTHFS